MSLITAINGITSGAARATTKLSSAVIMTVQPVANIIEIASESSLAWSESHAADLAAKTERRNKVREQTNRDLLRQAIVSADEASIETNILERRVQLLIKQDSVSGRIHKAQCDAFDNISDADILKLAAKSNLTNADILREAKVGTISAPVESSAEPKSNFSIEEFN